MLRLALPLLILRTGSAFAADVPLEEWLRKPGVRLVAVQSVPQKCDACRKEAARWQAFAGKHRARGLRVISVVARDPMSGCIEPGWKPDEIVCDLFYDGVAKRLRLREREPTVFLWSWKGEMLVERGDLASVEREVTRQLASSLPQLVIDLREGDRERLRDELREAVTASNKYRLSTPATESARIAALGRGSYASIHLGIPKCEVGRGLEADAILGVRVAGAELHLTLRSEAGCRVESTTSSGSTEDAVSSLLAKIPRTIALPAPPQPNDLSSLTDPKSKQLARTLEKLLGRTDLSAAALARLLLRETFGVDIGETMKEQLASGPEVEVDLRDPERKLLPGDLIFYVSYAYVPKVVAVYLGGGLIAESADVRGVVVGPLPVELPYFFQSVARRPLAE